MSAEEHHNHLRTIRRCLATALVAVVIFAAFAYYQQLKHGEVVTALRTIGMGGAAWGLYIVFDGYFVGLSSTGIAIAAIMTSKIRKEIIEAPSYASGQDQCSENHIAEQAGHSGKNKRKSGADSQH